MAQLQNSFLGCGFEESTRAYESVPEAEREAIFEQLWEHGNGFRFMFGGFSDIVANPVANEAACAFIRKKIGEIVRDPEKARILMPTDRYARRPLCDSGYYEQFNRDNVHIVDVGAGNPISHFTEKGLVTQDGTENELDVVIFATGFDAVDGSYTRLQIRGVGGKTLQEHWAERGPTSYLGISVPNFPNLFMVAGPQGPFTNVPPAIETQVRFISFLIGKAELSRKVAAAAGAGGGSAGTVIEATAESEKMWMQRCQKIAKGSLFSGTPSWLFGSNLNGKKAGVRFYLGGLRSYNRALKRVAENGLRGFKPLVNETAESSDRMRNSRGKL
ncbi:cyclohexanone monooxygenase [Blastomyces silverae]|uniref:Cyclohexanone monooxygenase n=1 Tax=Blastomyces silverae TaxID=2060906 RepID=A0A0H1BIK6_9EURO|nr:cyclohexanone monooxygenase [Blastomyces silverae]